MTADTITRPPGGGANFGSSTLGYTSTPDPTPRQPFVLVAQNGEHSILQDGSPPPPTNRGGVVGRGWVRGRVRGKTRRARTRFLRFVAGIDQKVNPAARAVVLTISYGRVWPPDPEGWARDLKLFKQKLERKFGHVGTVWQKEFGGRRCPHYHLVAVLPAGVSRRRYVREARKAWRAVTGDDSAAHARRGTYGKPLGSWRKIRGYLAKSEGLPPDPTTGRPQPTGRMWSVWRPEKLTITYRKVSVSGAVYLRLRRIFRRIARPISGPSRLRADVFHRQHVMIAEGEMMRLLRFLGVDTT